jgi:hypothetical protein
MRRWVTVKRRVVLAALVCASLPLLPGSEIKRATPVTVASVALTGQVAAIAATNLLAAAPAGLYHVSAYIQTTNQSVGACTSTLTIGWTYNAAVQAGNAINLHSHAVDEAYSENGITLRSQAAANITYAVDLVGGANCANAVYDIYVVMEKRQ